MKKIVSFLIYLVIIPLSIYFCFLLYKFKKYDLFSLIIAFLAIIPFFLNFEKKNLKIEKIVLISAFVAITTLSRLLFNLITFLPGFNPISAIIILIALAFDGEIGFMVGTLTALISNNYLGHGPWTIFQMFSWGIIGYLSGILKNVLKKNWVFLVIFGVFSAVLYSLIMDTYTVLSYDNAFNFKRFLVISSISLPFTITYVIANVLFLVLFRDLFLKRLERIIKKYNLS